MRNVVCLVAWAVPVMALTGCATIQAGLGKVGNFVCDHQVEVTTAANQALDQANQINDPTRRAVAISAAEAMLNAVAACPVAVNQTEN